MYTYNARVIKVVDGDTVDCVVDLGFNVFTNVRFRFYGIDTPEMHQKDIDLRSIAKDAKSFVEDTLLNKSVTIKTHKTDKYGRWLAEFIEDENSPTINEQLIALGLARAYFGTGPNVWLE